MGGSTNSLGGPDGQGGPHVFVADLESPTLDAADRHHFERVLRVRPGDALTVSDGAGGWRSCRYGDVLDVVSEVAHERRREPALTIAFAPVKGDRPEWVVQKLTELGIDEVVILSAERSVVRWDGDRAERQIERLTKVAKEAAMQCRRCHLPRVAGIVGVSSFAADTAVVRADMGGDPPESRHSTVLIGPEGGWSDAERALVPGAVGLGDHVLRSETAAITASVLYTALRARHR